MILEELGEGKEYDQNILYVKKTRFFVMFFLLLFLSRILLCNLWSERLQTKSD